VGIEWVLLPFQRYSSLRNRQKEKKKEKREHTKQNKANKTLFK
jgi:hypothetical protein